MTGQTKKIAVIGSGAWGTALADVFSRAGHDVFLYARDAGLAEAINKTHDNAVYLPGTKLHEKIKATADLQAAVAGADFVLLVTPAQFVRHVLQSLKPFLPATTPVVNCAKGIEITTGKILSQVAAEVLPGQPYGALSGPNFAHEVAAGLPCAATLAGQKGWEEVLSSKTFRPYISDDVVGVEVAGAMKNVIAIACGMVEGKKLGQNARAAVMTRGMAEIKRFGLAMGAKAETFLGLSGLGDLVLTCNSMNSRNFSLGAALGAGKTLEEIMASRKSVAEGVATSRAIADYACNNTVDMPICCAVDAILHQNAKIDDIVRGLLSRHLRPESE
jgi:glycerol-3-phosphate dehydrogenase (NAD(P)+)